MLHTSHYHKTYHHYTPFPLEEDISHEPVYTLRSLKTIFPTEQTKWEYTCFLKEKILQSGVWTTPVVVERETSFLLDGHHRYQAAQLLGLHEIPCILVDYRSPLIQVYCRNTQETLDKSLLLERYRRGSLLPHKYTQHIFDFKIAPTSFTLRTLSHTTSPAKIVQNAYEINFPNIYTEINFITPASIFLKNEGLNVSGSIKHKTAHHMISALEKEHGASLNLIESSSGNLGIALSLIAKARGHRFTCVVDPNILPAKKNLMHAYGATIISVDQPDKNGGYLNTRIEKIKEMQRVDPSLVWINQYSNTNNPEAHFLTTAKEIFHAFQLIDYLFIGAGTTGTLMGCATFFKKYAPHTKIIAVDAEGSVTFGGKAKKRYIPGLGTSTPPPICDRSKIDDLLFVSEKETVKFCHMLQERGFLYGGSTGTVLAGIAAYHAKTGELTEDKTIVTLAPDFGEPYLETVYSQIWLEAKNLIPA